MTLDSIHAPARRMPAGLLALGVALAATAGVSSAQTARPLNDTGSTQCVVNGKFTKNCVGTGQDGEFGRDVNKNNNADGARGFSYAKVCNSGEVAGSGTCPASPVLGTGANDWACTLDKVSKLIWEVKTSSGLRGFKKVYTAWGDGRSGDASEFVAQVNAQGLCGANDWRLPTSTELQGLMHFGVASPGPMIDTAWFPQTAGGATTPSLGVYLSSSQFNPDSSSGPTGIWIVEFSAGFHFPAEYAGRYAARLVRKGQ